MDYDYRSVKTEYIIRKNSSTQTDLILVDISNLEQSSKQLDNMKEWISKRLTSLDEPTSQLFREFVSNLFGKFF